MDNYLIKVGRLIGLIPGNWLINHTHIHKFIGITHLLIAQIFDIWSIVILSIGSADVPVYSANSQKASKCMSLVSAISNYVSTTIVILQLNLLNARTCQNFRRQFKKIDEIFAKHLDFPHQKQNKFKYGIIYIFLLLWLTYVHIIFNTFLSYWAIWCEMIKMLILFCTLSLLDDIELRCNNLSQLIMYENKVQSKQASIYIHVKPSLTVDLMNDIVLDWLDIQEAIHEIITGFNDVFGTYIFFFTISIFSFLLNDVMIFLYWNQYHEITFIIENVIKNLINMVSCHVVIYKI